MRGDGTTTTAAAPSVEWRGTGCVGAADQGQQRPSRSGATGAGVVRGGAGALVYRGRRAGGLPGRGQHEPVGVPVQRAGAGGVAHRAGAGRTATYGVGERSRVVTTAQWTPDREQDGTATWSLSTLERAARSAGLPRIGATTIRRVLRAAGSSYQRTRTWCPTGTAVRTRKSGPVRVIDPDTEKKGAHRTGVSASRGGRRAGVVPG